MVKIFDIHYSFLNDRNDILSENGVPMESITPNSYRIISNTYYTNAQIENFLSQISDVYDQINAGTMTYDSGVPTGDLAEFLAAANDMYSQNCGKYDMPDSMTNFEDDSTTTIGFVEANDYDSVGSIANKRSVYSKNFEVLVDWYHGLPTNTEKGTYYVGETYVTLDPVTSEPVKYSLGGNKATMDLFTYSGIEGSIDEISPDVGAYTDLRTFLKSNFLTYSGNFDFYLGRNLNPEENPLGKPSFTKIDSSDIVLGFDTIEVNLLNTFHSLPLENNDRIYVAVTYDNDYIVSYLACINYFD